MYIEIKVVDADGEPLFEERLSGLRFDVLKAFDGFIGGKLAIRRSGKVVAETSDIAEYGTHGACTCFAGLRGIFDDTNPLGYAAAAIGASDCRVGDELLLDIPQDGGGADFAEALRVHYRAMNALDAVFQKHGGRVTTTEAKNAIDILKEGMTEAMPLVEVPEILRFNRRP